MTIISMGETPRPRDSPVLSHEVRMCRSGLLYADHVRLISPFASIVFGADRDADSSAETIIESLIDSIEKSTADEPGIQEVLELFRAQLGIAEAEIDQRVKAAVAQFRRLHREKTERMGFGELKCAVDRGLLTIDPTAGFARLIDQPPDEIVTEGEIVSVVSEIHDLLHSGRIYPLFDARVNRMVRDGVKEGYLKPVPTARRLGADAAMADGLFDRLPNFPLATMAEILDIRDALTIPLNNFRAGVRELTEEIDLAPEDLHFGAEIEDAWHVRVAPALDEIEDEIRTNTSIRDLLKRGLRDPAGLGALASASALPASLAIAAGPLVSASAIAGFAVGLSVAAARSFLTQSDDLHDATKAQFYFLYGANERMGR
ncbi:hypothetical protein OK015_16525 [Mycobacterium sp. Aquia_216]|uniref:hypothetical protein n=1 Tax=Mycobacterium sp. Aquia_216 TaxID=2991729 RepID=UPI00227AD35C|nr:hypothetical protein [Mycobacterium sp. Aquia_216]WAJ42866.1 hypothetical protein OK015_16525 [Mycobacterium sp. Aquia_216]